MQIFNGWDGGDCPVDETTRVNVWLRKGKRLCNQVAGDLQWQHVGNENDIVCYRVLPK